MEKNEKETLQKALEKLRQENALLKQQVADRQVFVGKNGNICCRVKGRSPINLYKDQWETILQNANRIKEYLVLHQAKLLNTPEETEMEALDFTEAEVKTA